METRVGLTAPAFFTAVNAETAGGEHGIDDEDLPAGERRELAIVGSGFGGLVIPFQPDITHAHIGKDIGEGLHHAESGAQDRHDDEWLMRQDPALHPLERRVDFLRHGLDPVGRLNRQQQANLVRQGAKRRRLRGLVAQVRDDVRRERMIENVNGHEGKGGKIGKGGKRKIGKAENEETEKGLLF